MSEQEEIFECHNIYLAAYLSECGCELSGRRKQGHRVFFQFKNIAGSVQTLREDYFSGKGKVTACKFADAIMKMKELLSFGDS